MLQQLLADARVLVTPQLGASAREVQAQVAVEVARQIVSVLRGDYLHDSAIMLLLPAPS